MASGKWILILAVTLLATPAAAELTPWRLKVDRDPMTDEATQVAEVILDRTFLQVRCFQGKPSVILGVPDLVGEAMPGGRAFAPAFRVDDLSASPFAWNVFQRGGFLQGDQAAVFLQQIEGARVLRTRIVTWENRPIDNEFPLDGAFEMATEAVASCTS